MADSILFNLAGNIITKLGSFAYQELAFLWGVPDELDKLKDIVSSIQAVLLQAEKQQSNGQNAVLEVWILDLKDALYDIDDLFDELSYESLRRQVIARDGRRKTCKQVRMFFSKSNPIAFTLKIGHKIKEIKERLSYIDTKKDQFKFSELPVSINNMRDDRRKKRETVSNILNEEVIGRNDAKKAIIDLLLKPNTKEDIAVISIVGMGGLGKTALAQLVYKDNMILKHFEMKLWVCISEEFDVHVIIEKIIESATSERPATSLQLDILQSKLRKLVDGKKYLLVMDDVWNENYGKWVTLKRSLMAGAKGSRILVTTRSEKVAKTLDTSSSYPLEILSKEDSWLLFEKMTFLKGSPEEPENSNLVEIGKEIVAKLKGVPIAIIAIGRLLYNKKSFDFWLSFKEKELNNQIIEKTEDQKDMQSILELSYNHLPFNLKQCFLYCAVFPKDFYIQKDELILQWRAQGFIQPNDIDIGEDYFMELLSSSFFQDVREDEFGDIQACKMHDLMHDLACSISKNECGHEVVHDINKRTHHFSLDSMSGEKLEALSKARNLRTLFVKADNDRIFEKIFYNHLRLRALGLDGRSEIFSEKVSESITKLKHLRYLNISEGDIKFLSCSIKKLYNLETLILCCWGD